MSGISSVSASTTNSLLDYLQNSSKSSDAASTTGTTGPDCAGKADQGGPSSFLTSELQQQGFSGTDLDDLLKKIQDAVKAVPKDSNGKPDRSAIHDAVNQVLKDAGVDTDKIDKDFKAKGHHHHGGGAKSGSSDDIDPLLESLGVDPTKFKSALQSAIQNVGSDGSIDLSQIFASAAAGSQLDLKA